MSVIVLIHALVRWAVLLALIAAGAIGFTRYRNEESWRSGLFRATTILFDVQVLLGAVIWVGHRAWNLSFFFRVLHPAAMIAAVLVAHLGVALADKKADYRANAIAASGLTLALILVIVAIPWFRL